MSQSNGAELRLAGVSVMSSRIPPSKGNLTEAVFGPKNTAQRLAALAASRADPAAAPYSVDKQAQQLATLRADPTAAPCSNNRRAETLATERAARSCALTRESALIKELLDHGGVEGRLGWTSGSSYAATTTCSPRAAA